MNQSKKTILIFILLLSITSVYSQMIKFKHLSADDGLSQNTIKTIIQDSKGFLWFGTSDGLNRYDGFNFKQFRNRQDDSTSIPNNDILCSYLDSKGYLWFGTNGGGVSYYDYRTETFRNYKGVDHIESTLSENTVRCMIEDDEGFLWIGTDWGLNRFDYSTGEFLRFTKDKISKTKFSPQEVFSITKDSEGILWIGTWRMGLIKFNPKDFSFESIHPFSSKNSKMNLDNIWSVYCDSKDRIWTSYWGSGVAVIDKQSGKITKYRSQFGKTKTLGKDYITEIYEDSEGQIYLGTDGDGLNLFNEKLNNFTTLKNNPSNKYSISEDGIESIYQDRSGVVWIGTWGGGLNYFDKRQLIVEHYSRNTITKNSLSHNEIRGFYIDPESDGNIIWIATDGGGLNKLDRKKQEFSYFRKNGLKKNSIKDDVVLSVYKIKNELWIGTYTGGLNRINIKTGKTKVYVNDLKNPKSIPSNFVRQVMKDSKGNIWVSTNGGGIAKFNERDESFKSYKYEKNDSTTISHNTVVQIYEDSFGEFWIATHSGLCKFNPYGINPEFFKRYNVTNSLISSNKIFSICEDSNNNIWIGTAAGLSKYSREKDDFEVYDENDGFTNSTIIGILEDDQKNLWLSTNRGINKFNPETNEISNFTIDDGLQSNQFYMGAYFKSPTGELLFGGNNGFNIFYPDSLQQNETVPDVAITNIKLFNESLIVDESNNTGLYLSKSAIETDTLVINHEDHILTIEFAALHFSNPKQNKYSYILEGFEKKWNNVGNRNFATYTNIDPGVYTFKVKASNHNEIWNNITKNLTLIVIPPFYQTWTFYILSFLLFLFIIYAIYLNKVRKFKKFNRELKIQVNERTKKLKKQTQKIIEQSKQLEKQSREIENTNIELEQINYELEERVEYRTAELLEAKNKAEKADRVKSEFLAQMSHEIRTPVNSMLSYVGLFVSEIAAKLPDYLEDSVEGVQRSGKRIIRTIDTMINVAELQSNAYDFNIEEIDLEEVISGLISIEYNNFAQLKNLQLEIIAETDDTIVSADKYSIEQVFSHLIDNAIKYTEIGSVTVFMTDQNDKIIVKISDTGIGIDDEYLPIIFKPFTQEEQGYTRKFDGNGLGLTLVKKFCELNNAEIKVNSTKGEGTTFTIVLQKALDK